MDPRVSKIAAVPAVRVPSERLIEFFADSAAMQAYIVTLDIANTNAAAPSLAARQLKAQQEMLAALPEKTAPTAADLAQQHQPVRPFVVYQPMTMQQQSGMRAPLTAEQRTANEDTRQRQYDAQIAMLAAKAVPTP